jgi:hypothetical protein
VFWEKCGAERGFLMSERGGTRGKRGQVTVVVRGLKMGQVFQVYFGLKALPVSNASGASPQFECLGGGGGSFAGFVSLKDTLGSR